jgi:hypothetical protein
MLSACLVVAGGIARAQAQPVLLRVTPPVGQATHYRSVTQSWMQIPGMPAGDSTQPTMTQTLFTTRTVTGMDGTARIITTVVDSSRQDMGGMGGMGGDMLRGMTTTQHVDPRGNVLSTDVTPPPGAPPMIAQAMRQGGGSARGAAVMPERAIEPGATWTDSMTIPVGAGQQTVFHVTYKLERLERLGGARVATVSWQGTVRSDSAAMGGAGGTMTGQLTLDLEAGRLTSSTTEMHITTQTPQGAMPIRSKSTMQVVP